MPQHCAARTVLLMLVLALATPADDRTPVVLVHGLGRTSNSMRWLARRLEESGFRPIMFNYPSRDEPVERLAERLAAVFGNVAHTAPCHVVTHSMGGVLLQVYAERHPECRLGRVVMLAPPAGGSEVADRLRISSLGRRLLGPAGCEMGTSAESVPKRLGPVSFELGVIAGSASWNPWFSAWIPGPDDGKIAVRHARVPGMREFLMVPCSHTWIMFDEEVIRFVIRFLREGTFVPRPGEPASPAVRLGPMA